MKLVDKLNRLPPCLVRILAKHNGRLITDPELMRRTGWGARKLKSVCDASSWEEIRIGDADKFLEACGMKWSSQRRQRWLLQLAISKGGLHTMRHLKVDTGWRGNQLRIHLLRIERQLTHER